MSLNSADEDPTNDYMSAGLQPDAQWKKIQQNTFTRWVNQHLKHVNVVVDDLETDFEEGLKLIQLVEVLSGRSLGRFNKRVTFRSQKLENISLALNFLENEEHIKIVNIDSSAIVDKNLKLILGLVWTLILHYSISKQNWELPDTQIEVPERTPKQKLMMWIKAKLPPGLPLNNFTSDWNDGVLLGALVDSCAPDLHLGWRDWIPPDALHSTRTAMQLAEKHLDIAPLITPEELINPAVDEKSVMTYLAQFPQAHYKPALGRVADMDVSPIVGGSTTFTVHTLNAVVTPDVLIRGPDGQPINTQIHKVSSTVYEIKYVPQMKGEYEIAVTIRDPHSGDSSRLNIERAVAVDSARLIYESSGRVGKRATFRVENAEESVIELVIVDPKGNEIMPVLIREGFDYVSEFTPKFTGVHSVNVFQKKRHIPGSPFPLSVAAPATFRVWGRGVAPEGVRVDDEVNFFVDASEDSTSPLTVHIRDPAGQLLPVDETLDEVKRRHTFVYRPQTRGKHEVELKCGDNQISKSPYEVRIGERTTSQVRAFGPGLEGGVAKLPAIFYVETNGDTDQLGFSIEGPSKTEINCTDVGDGSAVVKYTPEEPGIYEVNVLSRSEHIKDSPFVLMVEPPNEDLRPSAVRVLGIEPSTIFSKGDRAIFQIDTTDAGVGALPQVKLLDSRYAQVPVSITEKGKGIYECSFRPQSTGRYYVNVSAGGVAVPGSPFMVKVREAVDASQVRVYGPGVGPDVRSQQPTHFFIDAKGAGPGEVEVALCDREGSAVDLDVLDNNDGSFTVKYTAPRPGAYQLKVVFAGVEIPRVEINVKPHVDISGIRVEGLENENVLVGHRKEILINTGGTIPHAMGIEAITEDPDGRKYLLKLTPQIGGIFSGGWTAQKLGETKFSIFFDGVLVKEARTMVREGEDASKCRAVGEGLERAIVGERTKFRIDTQGAGEGSIAMAIKGPSESKTTVTDHSNGSCTVEYVLLTPGLYEINIVYGEKKEPIPGSPFTTVADYRRDVSKIAIEGFEGKARVGVPTSFVVDATRTAALPVDARLPVGQQQPIVEEIEPRKYRITFNLSGNAGDIVPIEVLYGGEPISNRPLSMMLSASLDPSRVKLKDRSGGSFPSEARASLPAAFMIDVSEAGKPDKLSAEVTGPDGRLRKSTIIATGEPELYELSFTPDLAGVYEMLIFCNETPISRSPYRIRCVPVGDANRCVLRELPKNDLWGVGEPRKLAVDVGNAGTGALSVVPMREHEVEWWIERVEGGLYYVTLKPLITGPHTVFLFYGGREIPNGAISFECLSPSELAAREEQCLLRRSEDIEERPLLQQQPSGSAETPPLSPQEAASELFIPRDFKFSLEPDYDFDKLAAIVTMPSGKHDVAQIKDNHDGTVTVTYKPTQYGHHTLSIQHNGVNMVGSPIAFFVDEAKAGPVTVYGPGLSHAFVGEPAAFTVSAKGSPAKELSVAVEGCAKATIQCHDNKDGTCSVAWVPPVPGEYKVHVKLAGKPVKDSPFTVMVAGEGQKRAHLSVGSTSEVSLNIAANELKGLSASIKSPQGIEEPCFIRSIDANHIGVSFTPREEGEHLITVKKNGRVIPKSPFRVKVDKTQVGDASKVVVTGKGMATAVCQEFNDIIVDTRHAGFGGLSVSVEGPSKAELNCKEAKDGLIHISYRPTEPGIYILSVKFADLHVTDSPFTVNCTGKGIGAVKEMISKEAAQAPVVLPGQDACLYLHLPHTAPMEMNAKVMMPNGRSEDVEMRDLDNNYYQIRFRPEVEGTYAVSVFHRDQHVSGSPFQFTVGLFEEGGAHKVRAAGIGLLRGETNCSQSFNIYTREAGKGKLSVSVEGPSKAQLKFNDHKDGNCHVEYKVTAPGEYIISVKFNDEHIPDSPFKVFVSPATGEARRLELASFPDSGMPGKACTFTVLTHRAPGHLEAKVQTPSNKIETIDIVPIDEGESYALRFIPHETGNYYIDVTLDGAPMRDSPFRLRIGKKEENDPTAISVSGDGLHSGETGQKCEFIINTCNAGSGLLQVQIDGPSKVTLDAYELEQGYKVRYMALAPGIYYAAIKYSGVHIPGSPFKIQMGGKELGGGEPDTSLIKIDALAKTSKGTVTQVPEYKGDASKVTVKGAGLNKFFPGRPASFNIDTAMAGNNLLFVGVVTTKGPCEEVTVRHNGQGHYVVTYRIQDRVKGFIFVKYGDANVPGSPFAISY
uniref:Filamin-A n=1 Tax=Ascaris suum TaxID=6253 RepID=F1KPN0_ASCSU